VSRKLELSARGLEAYRSKRSAERTPEPFGSENTQRPGLFAVQQHAARQLHFDLRLEWRGVLLSWAVPRGPSLDPAEKRLAVQVEDHPLEYADFEGVIPEGNYGAGTVIVWDLGRWVPVEDPDLGLERGKLLFDLFGYKLRGRFTLVRTGGRKDPDSKQWLWIKKPDAWASEDEEAPDPSSVLSGLSVEERRDGSPRLDALVRSVADAGLPHAGAELQDLRPMLAESIGEAFSDPDWLFEPKYDGYRILGVREPGGAHLLTRNGHRAEDRFPELARALAALPVERAVLDGEVVAPDAEGRPRFGLLQKRASLRRTAEVERAAVEAPVQYFAFDLLALEGHDLRGAPLRQRKQWLAQLLPACGPLREALWVEGRGEDLFERIEALGLEGMVAKRADSVYRAGRSPDWRKLRLHASDDFVLVGFTAPRGGRSGFGALHLATHRGGELVYAGRVGTGFSDAELVSLHGLLETLERETPPCVGPLPETRGHRWVEPRLVGEVRYSEVTADGLLRHPTWVGLREDKTPDECVAEGQGPDAWMAGGDAPAEPIAGREAAAAAREVAPAERPVVTEVAREVPFTNLEKIYWPEDGICKGDLLDYHRRIAPWLLPYLRDRPLVMTRYPDGIEGKSFFQKDAPQWAPDWVRTERIWSEQAEREVSYFVCDDLESLLYVVNLGTIPLHVWGSRVSDLQHPDWCIVDLDPKGAPFAHVVRLARGLHAICEELAVPGFVKTSGASGLHVLLPLGAQLTFEQCRMLAELLGRLLVQREPEIATLARRLGDREGKVYVDTLQNGHGRLLVAPFSVRPLPGGPVSMPLRWRELSGRLDPRRYTLRNAPARLKRLGEDPLAALLAEAPDWGAALARLAASVEA